MLNKPEIRWEYLGMGTEYHDIIQFHEKFDLAATRGPQPWDDEFMQFRFKFMREELDEFLEGMDQKDHAKMFDALLDLVYVAMGTAYSMGYPWGSGWALVQKANMAKVRAQPDGSDSLRGSSRDVIKPPGWTAPDIEGLLQAWGY
jgi:predicted HAD superfamily Cof-like phosphohydrolase